MAVIGFAAERPDSPSASFELGKIRITRKFLVRTSDIYDGPVTVLLAPGLPTGMSPYEFGAEYLPFMLCRSIEPERVAPGSLEWDVTCVYESPEQKDIHGGEAKNKDGGGTGKETPEQFLNPLLATPEIEVHFQSVRELVYAAVDPVSGEPTPCQASNGEIFIPAPERERSYLQLKITRNEDINFLPPPPPSSPPEDETDIYFPYPARALRYQDRVNADTFWGADAGQVRCHAISMQRLTKNYPDGTDFVYLRVTYEFHFRDTWDLNILDKGSWYWTGTTPNKKKKFQTDDHQNTEGLLDGSGGALAAGDPPVFRTLQIYARVDFNELNLPQTFDGVQ